MLKCSLVLAINTERDIMKKNGFIVKLVSFIILLTAIYFISPYFNEKAKQTEEHLKDKKITEENTNRESINLSQKEKTVPEEKKNNSDAEDESDSKNISKDKFKDDGNNSVTDFLVKKGLLKEEYDDDGKLKGWISESGLFYGMGSKQGNRVLHVLEHLTPNPSKKKHSVFDTDPQGLIRLLDKAWKNKDKNFSKVQANGNRIYDIKMDQVIGKNGEKMIRIIVKDGTSNIITAYPRR